MSQSASDSSSLPPRVVNVDDAPFEEQTLGEHWGARYQVLTPSMRPSGGSLGVNRLVVPPGRTAVPFHSHRREDEVFFVLEGRGVLRYGDEPLRELRPGDCVACPAGKQQAHQFLNPFDADFVYLAIGAHDPDEVCQYPDTGKVMVRSLRSVGRLTATEYMDGEPDRPKILDLWSD
ncbi:MAG: cupin domain-containing protein [Planctomycetes bacterium]|nr:cupin domain-containing protein [Planctomycetota bacterium]